MILREHVITHDLVFDDTKELIPSCNIYSQLTDVITFEDRRSTLYLSTFDLTFIIS